MGIFPTVNCAFQLRAGHYSGKRGRCSGLAEGQGVDFIKVQSVISRESYLAAAAEAHKQGLPIVGHVPDKVRLGETVEAGQKSIEHLMGIFEACSTKEDDFIAGKGSLPLLLTTQD